MHRRLGRLRTLTLFAACAALVAAFFAWTWHDGLGGGRADVFRPDIDRQIMQLDNALAVFIADLSRYAEGDASIEQDDISRKFNKVWSMTAVLRTAPHSDQIKEFAPDDEALTVLKIRLQIHQPYLLDLDRTQSVRNRQIVEVFELRRADLRDLASAALTDQQVRRDDVRSTYQDALIQARNVAVAITAIALVLFALLAAQWVIHRQVRRKLHGLTRRARSADATRSRFLSMMSHELRTPMNGVLGLLQLLRQSRLSENQTRLVEQAERSGVQMTELLGDIMEFSELQAERLEIANEPFQPTALAASIDELLVAAALRHRTPVQVACTPGTPEWIAGDFPRLRQALLHLAGTLVNDEQVRTIELAISHDRGQLLCRFEVRNRTSTRNRDDVPLPGLGPETLGITIATGLISLMNGRITTEGRRGDLHDISIRLPAPIVYPRRDYVRIEERSETTALLMRRSVEDAGLALWSAADPSAIVSTILLELPVADEAAAVKRLQATHPGARLIAIGIPVDPAAFDDICPNAVDHKALLSALRPVGTSDAKGQIG